MNVETYYSILRHVSPRFVSYDLINVYPEGKTILGMEIRILSSLKDNEVVLSKYDLFPMKEWQRKIEIERSPMYEV